MPVFDTPINTDDQNFSRVLAQKLPIVLYLYNSSDKALDEALASAAREHKGKILVVRVRAADSPKAYAQYQRPALPALVTIKDEQVQSSAPAIGQQDIAAHVNFLLGSGPKPASTATQNGAQPSTSSAKPFAVNEANFASEVLRSSVPVLVDFWADWCQPCHMIAPTVDKIAQKYAGRVKVVKLNVDENQRIAAQYQAMSIPMLLVFKGGQPVGKLVGVQPQSQIEQALEKALRG